MANKESNIQAEIMLAMSEAGCLVWRQQVGTYRPIHGGHPIKIGLEGMADIGAIVPTIITPEMVGKTIGVAWQVEVKTPTGRQAQAQRTWEQAVHLRGGLYIVARSVAEAIKYIPRVTM